MELKCDLAAAAEAAPALVVNTVCPVFVSTMLPFVRCAVAAWCAAAAAAAADGSPPPPAAAAAAAAAAVAWSTNRSIAPAQPAARRRRYNEWVWVSVGESGVMGWSDKGGGSVCDNKFYYVMHGSNTRREQRQQNTQREIERERRNFEIIQLFVGGGSGLDITASERKVVSASEREERERKSKQRENNQLAKKKNKIPLNNR